MFFLLFLEPLPYDANFIITFVLPIQIVSRLAKNDQTRNCNCFLLSTLAKYSENDGNSN